MRRPEYTVQRITPQFGFEDRIAGLGFGEGKISAGDELPEVLQLVHDTIHHSPDILVPIDVDDTGQVIDDDGCGDGRRVLTVFSRDRTYKRSLNRCKVFGGSATMTAAIKIGTGEAADLPLNDVFEVSVDTLVNKNIDFGAHTDEHAAGDKCGCGAIDSAQEIIFATLKYETAIRGVIDILGLEQTGLDDVYDNFRRYAMTIAQNPEYSGRKVADKIIDEGKVVKLLGGEHRERGIVLNQIRDYTINQQLIREVTEDRAQVFAVDVWRLSDIATNLYEDQPELQSQALLSEVIYTLATAAVLTKGDLPVDMIQPKAAPVVA